MIAAARRRPNSCWHLISSCKALLLVHLLGWPFLIDRASQVAAGKNSQIGILCSRPPSARSAALSRSRPSPTLPMSYSPVRLIASLPQVGRRSTRSMRRNRKRRFVDKVGIPRRTRDHPHSDRSRPSSSTGRTWKDRPAGTGGGIIRPSRGVERREPDALPSLASSICSSSNWYGQHRLKTANIT